MHRRILHFGLMFYSNCFEILKKLSLNLHFGSEFQWGNGIFSGDLGDLIQEHPLPGSLPIIHIPSDGFSKACSSATCISLPQATQEPLCTPGRGLGIGIEKVKGGYMCPGGSQAGTWQQPSLPSAGHTVQMTL